MEENNKQPEQEQETPLRSSIIMLLAGIYLLYTGYKLCKNVLDGVEGGGWGFFAAGVGFLIVGIVMLVVGGRDLMKREKAKREAEAAAQEQTQEQSEPEPVEQKKSMSIAERAHLADELHEAEPEMDSETTEGKIPLGRKSDKEDSE